MEFYLLLLHISYVERGKNISSDRKFQNQDAISLRTCVLCWNISKLNIKLKWNTESKTGKLTLMFLGKTLPFLTLLNIMLLFWLFWGRFYLHEWRIFSIVGPKESMPHVYLRTMVTKWELKPLSISLWNPLW